jgi:hypothetical protein
MSDGAGQYHLAVETEWELRNPTHGSGWLFRSNLKEVAFLNFMNPTHGSGWIVQIQPKRDGLSEFTNPTHGSGWIVQIQT